MPQDVEQLVLGRRNRKVVSLGLVANALTGMPPERIRADDAAVPGMQRREGLQVVGEPDVIGVQQRDQGSVDASDGSASSARRRVWRAAFGKRRRMRSAES